MSAIDDKYAALGGPAGLLGSPTTPEQAAPDGVGRFRHYQRGSIYWTALTGAHEVHGAIRGKWSSLGWERSLLGYPLTDELPTPDGVGRFNHFAGGSIYWTLATGAHEVHGDIRIRWAALGWERGHLGYPTSDEMDTPHGDSRMSHFQGGAIYWDPQRRAYEVYKAPPPEVCNGQAKGKWQTPAYNSGVVGVHAALLHTNKILFFTYRDPGPHAPHAPQPHGDSSVLDLATGTVTRPPLDTGEMNLFCAGQALMADGRLFIGGGERQHPGVLSLHTFTPGGADGGTWKYLRDMPDGRWYATCTTLHNGRIFILGGRAWNAEGGNRPNATYEIFAPVAGLQPRRPAPILTEVGPFDTYPFVFVLPSGKLFIHAGARTRFLNLSTLSFDATALEAAARPGRHARTYNMEGTCVLLPLMPNSRPPYRARVMVMGGGGAPPVDIRTTATNTCEILDLGEATPAWRLVAPMAQPRVMPDAVLLPDGKVLVMNGSSTGFADNGANPVYEAELYDPASNTWTTLCRMKIPRLYHATALLLPDGRVMTTGTDSMWNPDPFHIAQLRLEFFSPPYLFRGARPTISNAPADIRYNTGFTVATPSAGSVTSVSLLRCGSVTHSFNSDQRYVGLTINSRTTSSLTLQAPPNGFVAPPGYYLLFILKDGVPSVGRFVRLRP
ncbi:MAG TPA: galactose oxidase-like domain-containing protein [Pyrinomonadaceae bacterium]|nr:galactose oxidase-like domain-containing protein [Pyrinomonadaceae bacterium]